MDVAQSPAVQFVGNVVNQITDVTEHMDQRMDQFLTGIVRPAGDESAAVGSPARQLPVSNPSAPVLGRPSEAPCDVQHADQEPASGVEDWGDFDFDDDDDAHSIV
jgi:hypothetical protein